MDEAKGRLAARGASPFHAPNGAEGSDHPHNFHLGLLVAETRKRTRSHSSHARRAAAGAGRPVCPRESTGSVPERGQLAAAQKDWPASARVSRADRQVGEVRAPAAGPRPTLRPGGPHRRIRLRSSRRLTGAADAASVFFLFARSRPGASTATDQSTTPTTYVLQ